MNGSGPLALPGAFLGLLAACGALLVLLAATDRRPAAKPRPRRLRRLLESGVIRRIGAVPNHYALGYTANGMSVWDVPDERIDVLGEAVGRLPFVTHCYHRPRALPLWPYNLFAMVHGKSRDEVEVQVKQIAALLGAESRAHDVLYSSRILKKTGLRIGG